ncbi:carboxypeptidase-like regulatory domain-containing protein [Psychroserpens sp. SPM9]|uniref:carboxypeptidase-like regulatory domain-containing protein n=1 Tax=Psychroserpens sp. SPM9 TaxID=2975598 RepID=UPI0021A2B749|nr:carboxypeptidase-like regulatory domain-containing protein [Psychroserpens sp. SPM9]MDG5493255.1 carboxypeptidase-like regulatory domain-containing protein [Psychroserpens sp. SPM9]
MKKTVLILIILLSNLTLGQNRIAESHTEFRRLAGILMDADGQPLSGQNVIIKGTSIGTQTDFDGKFCIMIPKNKTIFIELPFCFDQIFREIKPTEKIVEMRIGKGKRKSKKAWRNYDKIKAELNSELNKIYNSSEYKNAEKYCG